MARRRRDIPAGVEVVDLDGTIIAAGEIKAPAVTAAEPADVDQRTSRKRWILSTGAIAVAVVALAAAFLGNDTEPEVGDPLGIIGQGAVDVPEGLIPEATFPLFGRQWDHELIVTSAEEVIAIDLNTGTSRSVGAISPTLGGYVAAIRLIDGEFYAVDSYGKVDHLRAEITPEEREAYPERRIGIVGNYLFDQTKLGDDIITLTHIARGTEVDLVGVIDFHAVGDDIFFEQGGRIGTVDRTGEMHDWAPGEILAVGPTRLLRRECASIDRCSYWSGSADDASERRLDNASRLIVGLSTSSLPGWDSPAVELLSPSGRYAWIVGFDQAQRGSHGNSSISKRAIRAHRSASQASVCVPCSLPTRRAFSRPPTDSSSSSTLQRET